MNARRKPIRPGLQVELLEERRLLDGGARVRVDSSRSLVIEGDKGDNCVLVDRALGPVGYFTDFNEGTTAPAAPILQAGLLPVQITDIGTFDLDTLDMLMIDESNNDAISEALLSRLNDVRAWVETGGVLIVHDRLVSDGIPPLNPLLVGAPAIVSVRDFVNGADLDVIPPGATLVTTGPFGTIDNTSLDGGFFSNHGFAVRGSLPAGAVSILSAGPDATNVAAFSYPLGSGLVYYATIPLDFYLDGNGEQGLRDNLNTVYTPNVLAYATNLAGGTVSVTGCSDSVGLPTQVNGVPNGQAVFEAREVRELRVRLKGGDDAVCVGCVSQSFVVPRDVHVETSKGNDFVFLVGVAVGGEVSVDSSDGVDTIQFFSGPLGATRVAGKVRIDVGKGNDFVNLVGASFGRALNIGTSDGDDTVFLNGVRAAADVGIDTGSGGDFVALFDGVGPISVTGQTRIDTGNGNDFVEFFGADIGGDLEVRTGNGSDFLGLLVGFSGGITRVAGRARFDTSDGLDNVFIDFAILEGRLTVELGNGDDAFCIRSSTIGEDFQAHGGNGMDTFSEGLSNGFSARKAVENFEVLGSC